MGNKANLVLYGWICLSDIPKELIKEARNNKIYLDIAIVKLAKINNFGNSHFISCSPKKEERIEGKNYIIGNLKTYTPIQDHLKQEDNKEVFVMKEEDAEDLPF